MGIGEAKIKKNFFYILESLKKKIKNASLEELKAVLNEVDSKKIYLIILERKRMARILLNKDNLFII